MHDAFWWLNATLPSLFCNSRDKAGRTVELDLLGQHLALSAKSNNWH